MERRSEWVMGTRLTIAVPAGRRAAAILREAFAIARELDAVLSDYKPESPLSRLGERAGGPAAPVDARLLAFLARAREDSARTGGAFDVTVGALMRLYREGVARPERLERARAATGWRHIEIRPDGAVRLARPGMRLDPGGIGKGYAVDAIVERLRARGVRRAFVDFGESSFYGLGAPRGRRGWPVLVRAAEPGRYLGIVWLRDRSLATSHALPPPDPGRSASRGHIVDPRTGRLVVEARATAVLSPSATDADVLSTALVVEPALQADLSRRYPGAAAATHTAGHPPRVDAEFRRVFEPAP